MFSQCIYHILKNLQTLVIRIKSLCHAWRFSFITALHKPLFVCSTFLVDMHCIQTRSHFLFMLTNQIEVKGKWCRIYIITVNIALTVLALTIIVSPPITLNFRIPTDQSVWCGRQYSKSPSNWSSLLLTCRENKWNLAPNIGSKNSYWDF